MTKAEVARAHRAQPAAHSRAGELAERAARQGVHEERHRAKPSMIASNAGLRSPDSFDDGRVCMTNNAAERELRPVSVGRRSWTFAGSDAGRRAAAVYTSIRKPGWPTSSH
jgi:transposase